MELAYTDAAGRSSPNFTELGGGEIGGLTLVPGLYKWGTVVLISTNVTLSGGPNDVFIFQIAGTLTQANATPGDADWRCASEERVLAGRRRSDDRNDRAL